LYPPLITLSTRQNCATRGLTWEIYMYEVDSIARGRCQLEHPISRRGLGWRLLRRAQGSPRRDPGRHWHKDTPGTNAMPNLPNGLAMTSIPMRSTQKGSWLRSPHSPKGGHASRLPAGCAAP